MGRDARLDSMLFDTHVLVWDFLTPNQLSQPAREAFATASKSGTVLAASISLWEIAMIVQKGKIQIEVDCERFIQSILAARKITVVPLTPNIATRSVQLPRSINKDPSDRLIVATALAENVPLVTADQNLRKAKIIPTIW